MTIINTDRSTWPTGDKVWQFCQAIAQAEGYNVAGSVPARLHNPGDISDGSSQFNQEAHDGSSVTHFPDDDTGWQWLYTKIHNALTGKSHVFLPTMTFLEFGQKYAGDWQHWVPNVCRDLGVTQDQIVGEWYAGS